MSRPNREEARVLGSHAPQAVFGLAFRSVCVVILHPALAAAYASGEGCAPIALLWDRIMCLRAVCCGCYDGNGSPDWCALCLCALLSSVDPIPPPPADRIPIPSGLLRFLYHRRGRRVFDDTPYETYRIPAMQERLESIFRTHLVLYLDFHPWCELLLHTSITNSQSPPQNLHR